MPDSLNSNKNDATPEAAATTTLLDYLRRQVLRFGDQYTADLLGDVVADQKSGALSTTASLKLLAALLAHEDPQAAQRASKYASRRMAILALVNEIDIAFGRGTEVSVNQAHERLLQADPNLPRERTTDAVRRRFLRDHGIAHRDQDGRP